MGSRQMNGLNVVAVFVALGSVLSACGDDDPPQQPNGGFGGGGTRSEAGRGGTPARGGTGGYAGSEVESAGEGGAGAGGTEPHVGSGGVPNDTAGSGGVPNETGGIGGVPVGTGGVPTETGGTGGVPGEDGGTGGDSNVSDPYLQPTWLGPCAPIELSDDGRTVLAAEGAWTAETDWMTIDGPGGSTARTLLAMSGDGSVVFGESETASRVEVFRWTRTGGAVGLGFKRLADSQVATDRLGSVLLFWNHDEEADEARPYRWTASEGVTALYNDDADMRCSFPEAASLTATLASDGRRGYFGAIDFEGGMYTCDYGFAEPGKLGWGEWEQVNQVISKDGNSVAGLWERFDRALISRAGNRFPSDAAEICAHPIDIRDRGLVCPDDADTEISDLNTTGTLGVGLEFPSSGGPLAIAYRGTISQTTEPWRYSGGTTTLRASLPGYCVQVDGVRPQLSGDGSTVLAVGNGLEESGCFLASMGSQSPALPDAPTSFDGYGCEGCSTEAAVVGKRHQCAIRADRTVDCWGAGLNGELGNDAFADSLVPVRVDGLTDAVQLASTGEHTCARDGDGDVWCWGKNDAGQLGDGSRENRSAPVRVDLPLDATHIAAGAAHTCAILEGGSVDCWGSNANGQLGDGTTITSDVPVQVTVDGVSGATQVAAGNRASCALVGSDVQCWGSISPLGTTDVSQISMYGDGYCFLSHDGPAQWLNCFGAYFNGGLTLEGVFWTNTPPVTSLRAGPRSWCLRLADGRVGCFGANERVYGELGEIADQTAYPSLPILGDNGTCRFLPNGKLSCAVALWGKGVPECAFEPRR